jgi:hypothetical protein
LSWEALARVGRNRAEKLAPIIEDSDDDDDDEHEDRVLADKSMHFRTSDLDEEVKVLDAFKDG